VTAQNLDFQTISAALENYRHDFGDYPRNLALPRWNSAVGTSPPTQPPIFYSLATALLGPGPGITQTMGSGSTSYTALGDGNDGPGFRTRTINVPVPGTVVASGATVVDVTIPAGYTFNFVPGLSSIDLSSGSTAGNEEVIGILDVGGTKTAASYTGAIALDLEIATAYMHAATDNSVIKTATGKAWDAYLPPDKFKVEYIDTSLIGGVLKNMGGIANNGDQGQPVLVDRWGQPIQYFTRFGPSNNRTNDSVDYGNPPTANASVIAGPLFGVSTPFSIDAKLGENAIWDWHDGVPVMLGTTMTQWIQQPAGTPDLSIAFKWMLGDEPAQDNVIMSPETLRYTGPYILISAGPNSTWCDLSTTNVPNQSTEEYVKAFTKAANIYNFDR
jgi:hypothetical protein